MARMQTVKKARKAHGPCRVCQKEIEAGSSYNYWEFAFRGTIKIHPGCRSKVRRSWLTGSEILGTIWDMIDDYTPEGETTEEVAETLTAFAQQMRDDVIEGLFMEKLQAIEDGMGHPYAPVYEELEERMNEMEAYVDEMESAAQEIEGNEEYEDIQEAIDAAQEAADGSPE